MTIYSAARKYGLTTSYLRQLERSGLIRTFSSISGRIPLLSPSSIPILEFLRSNPALQSSILLLDNAWLIEYHPEFIEYYRFHYFIDKLCWILKLYYSGPEEIKAKQYRLDILFQNFLIQNVANNPLRNLSTEQDRDAVRTHLIKGWYNELVRCQPLTDAYLKIGIKIHGLIQEQVSLPWNIIQSYYAYYEYTNAIVYSYTNHIASVEHRKPSRYLDNNLISRLDGNVLFYPFNIYVPSRSTNTVFPKHARYNYASYPPNRMKKLVDLDSDIRSNLDYAGKGKVVSITDYLYEFRVWANYTGADTTISLQNGYLASYLIRNFEQLLFFWGGTAEMVVLTVLGEDELVGILESFVTKHLLKNDHYFEKWLILPMLVRFRCYKHLGLIKANLPYLTPETLDPILLKR